MIAKAVIGIGKFTVKIVGSALAVGLMVKGSNIVVSKLDKIIDDEGNLKTKKTI